MPQRDKRIDKLRRNPRAVTPDELHAVLIAAGFELLPRRGKGDHRLYAHPLLPGRFGFDPQTPHVKPVYVRQLLQVLNDLARREQEP